MDRCTGHCCKAFYMPLSPGEIERAAAYAAAYGTPGQHQNGWEDDRGGKQWVAYNDIEKIAAMVIPLNGGRPMATPPMPSMPTPEKPSHYYTCKHHLPDGNCGNYTDRPAMCREYPSYGMGARCKYRACEWDEQSPRHIKLAVFQPNGQRWVGGKPPAIGMATKFAAGHAQQNDFVDNNSGPL